MPEEVEQVRRLAAARAEMRVGDENRTVTLQRRTGIRTRSSAGIGGVTAKAAATRV
jgi:hypothetical protein